MQEREIIQNPGLGMPRPGAANRAKVRMIIGAAPLNNAMFRVTTGLLICRSGERRSQQELPRSCAFHPSGDTFIVYV